MPIMKESYDEDEDGYNPSHLTPFQKLLKTIPVPAEAPIVFLK